MSAVQIQPALTVQQSNPFRPFQLLQWKHSQEVTFLLVLLEGLVKMSAAPLFLNTRVCLVACVQTRQQNESERARGAEQCCGDSEGAPLPARRPNSWAPTLLPFCLHSLIVVEAPPPHSSWCVMHAPRCVCSLFLASERANERAEREDRWFERGRRNNQTRVEEGSVLKRQSVFKPRFCGWTAPGFHSFSRVWIKNHRPLADRD